MNPRIVEATRRLNYNIADNFVHGQNGFYRLIFQTKLGDAWSLRNEAYAATQNLLWRNVESTVWNPATQLVERGSFLLIYRNDLQVGNRLDLTWDGDARRPQESLSRRRAVRRQRSDPQLGPGHADGHHTRSTCR